MRNMQKCRDSLILGVRVRINRSSDVVRVSVRVNGASFNEVCISSMNLHEPEQTAKTGFDVDLRSVHSKGYQ